MLTYIIIAITVALSIMAFRSRKLFHTLSLSPYLVAHKNQWYRTITHVFIHGSYSHLAINMLVFWSFGKNVEQIYKIIYPSSGILLFCLLYFGATIVASFYDIAKHKDNYYYSSIGASAAVMAVVFSSIYFAPMSKIYLFAVVPIPAVLFGVCYLLYESYAAKKERDAINHNAHIVGAIFGLVFTFIGSFTKLLSI
ncbi:MAG: rhomboid family intramembrane serine protease [Rikenellaceae bacterium]